MIMSMMVVVLLTLVLLGAGVSTGEPGMKHSGVSNVTVITKNQPWPFKYPATLRSCSATRCMDA